MNYNALIKRVEARNYFLFNVIVMFLSNFPKVRIKEYSKGFAVEIEKKRWYGKKYWMPIETVTGLSDTWYYETIEMAASEAKKHFEWCLFDGYRKY